NSLRLITFEKIVWIVASSRREASTRDDFNSARKLSRCWFSNFKTRPEPDIRSPKYRIQHPRGFCSEEVTFRSLSFAHWFFTRTILRLPALRAHGIVVAIQFVTTEMF